MRTRWLILTLALAASMIHTSQAEVKPGDRPSEEEVQARIAAINRRLEAKGARWRAGVTTNSFLHREE